jgi:hypothetical protein
MKPIAATINKITARMIRILLRMRMAGLIFGKLKLIGEFDN